LSHPSAYRSVAIHITISISNFLKMVFLHASNGTLTAVLTNVGHTRLSVPLYAQDGTIQSTLTYTFPPPDNDAVNSVNINNNVTKLFFVGTDHLVALLEYTLSLCVVWNVVRGVMVHTIHDPNLLDVTASQDCLYMLIASSKSSSNNKLYLQEYAIASGKLVRKIKAGSVVVDVGGNKRSNPQLSCCVAGNAVAVRNGNIVKVLRLVDGSKVYKCKLTDASNTGAAVAGVLCSGAGMIVMDEASHTIANVVDFGIVIIRSGKQVATCALLEPPVTMQLVMGGNQLWIDHAMYTMVGSSMMKTTQVNGPSEHLALIIPTATSTNMTTTTTTITSTTTIVVQAMVYDTNKGVSFYTVSCVDGKGKALSKVDIAYEDEDDDAPKNNNEVLTTNNKRSADTITTTLGPGQAGGESMLVEERSEKRAKATSTSSDVDLDEPTIAERLKLLSDALENDNDDDDDNNIPADGLDFMPKKATTESLVKLQHQALSSGDDPMLGLALGVRDKTVMETSLKELEPDKVSLLLTKLTMRLANKPTRAVDFVPWIACVLTTGMIRNANQLRPLRNLLQEQVESFPHLLQLEGRLSMLASTM
jgi:hypothetical protein